MIQLDIYITGKCWPRMANLKKQFKCKSKTKFNPFSIGKIEKLDFSYSNNSTKFKINN